MTFENDFYRFMFEKENVEGEKWKVFSITFPFYDDYNGSYQCSRKLKIPIKFGDIYLKAFMSDSIDKRLANSRLKSYPFDFLFVFVGWFFSTISLLLL